MSFKEKALFIAFLALLVLQIFMFTVEIPSMKIKLDKVLETLESDLKRERIVHETVNDEYSSLKRKISLLEIYLANEQMEKLLSEERKLIDEFRAKYGKGHLLSIIIRDDIVAINDDRLLMVVYSDEGKKKLYYNPQTIAWYTIAAYEDFLEQENPGFLTFFFRGVKWMKDHCIPRYEAFDINGSSKILLDIRKNWWSEPFTLNNRTVRTVSIGNGKNAYFYFTLDKREDYNASLVILDDVRDEFEVKVGDWNRFKTVKRFHGNSTGKWIKINFSIGKGDLPNSSWTNKKSNVVFSISSLYPCELIIDELRIHSRTEIKLVDVGRKGRRFLSLEFYFFFPYASLNPPWTSAMAQGMFLEALGRAYEITGDPSMKETGDLILESFFVDSKSGGVRESDENHDWWYAEYPGSKNYVLNGFLTALKGLYIYYNATGSQKALYLFLKGVEEAKKHLRDYDGEYYTFYDLKRNIAKPYYHKYHVKLLSFLFNVTKDETIGFYLKKWSKYK